MQCPYCGNDSNVVDSRITGDGVRRRRTCIMCKRRFTTYEKVGSPSLRVLKRDGSAEPFDSDKLARVLSRVCSGRQSIKPEDILRITRDIEARLIDSGRRQVSSSHIVELSLRRLGEVDPVAYNRLAADYLDENGRLRLDVREGDPDSDGQLTLFEGDD